MAASIVQKSSNSRNINSKSGKSRLIAALLAIFFGGAGIHKFYLGNVGQGLLYILFSWTFIPMILGFLEGFSYMLMSDKSFESKYS